MKADLAARRARLRATAREAYDVNVWARRIVAETCAAQGVDEVITDPGTLSRVAALARQPKTSLSARTAIPPVADGGRAASHLPTESPPASGRRPGQPPSRPGVPSASPT